MTKSNRAREAGIKAEQEAVTLSAGMERATLEKDYAFLAGQNAYLAMLLTETQGNPSRYAVDALRCLEKIPLVELDEAAADDGRAKFLQLVDASRDNILLALELLRRIATGLEKGVARTGS